MPSAIDSSHHGPWSFEADPQDRISINRADKWWAAIAVLHDYLDADTEQLYVPESPNCLSEPIQERGHRAVTIQPAPRFHQPDRSKSKKHEGILKFLCNLTRTLEKRGRIRVFRIEHCPQAGRVPAALHRSKSTSPRPADANLFRSCLESAGRVRPGNPVRVRIRVKVRGKVRDTHHSPSRCGCLGRRRRSSRATFRSWFWSRSRLWVSPLLRSNPEKVRQTALGTNRPHACHPCFPIRLLFWQAARYKNQ